jgi:hypothetical protein
VTGVLYVALDFRPGTPIVLRGLDRRVPELPTVPTDIEVWTAKLERFSTITRRIADARSNASPMRSTTFWQRLMATELRTSAAR